MTWTHRYPGLFLGLLHADVSKRRQVMTIIKDDFRVLLQLSELSHKSGLAKAWLADLQWPLQTFCMEVFFMLYEIKFNVDGMTEEVNGMLLGFSRSFGASVVNEEAFNHLRNIASNHSNAVMGRASR